MLTSTHFAAVALALVSIAAPATAEAQQAATPATTRYQVTVVRIKADMLTEWQDLQRTEVVPALKKAGIKERQVWATAVGNGFEYTILTPFEKWAAMDGPGPLVRALGAEGAARLNAKTRRCIEVQRTFMTNRIDDLNVAPGNALVMRTTVLRIQPGKMGEYQGIYRAEMLPGLKKAKADGKIAGSAFAVRGVGAPAGEFTTTTYYNKFADLDTTGNPLVAALGQDAVTKINAKTNPLATAVQTIVRRRVAELSF